MKIVALGYFNQVQKAHQVTGYCWLVVNLGGLNSLSVEFPSGRQLCSLGGPHPFALLLPKGSVLDFDYGEGRENWVIMFPEGTVKESPGGVTLSWNQMQGNLPGYHPLDAIQAERSRDYLMRTLQARHDPDTDSSLAIDLMVCGLLDCILSPELPIEEEGPAEALRRRIIADDGFVETLSALSLDCGYSVDHVRRLFEARFDVTPKAFRRDYRMHIASDLLKLHNLSVKTVSDRLAFSSPAHFSMAFKKHFGETPGAYRTAE
jgi:AraC-like DNA-binding protein